MKLAALSLLIGSAAAFAPASTSKVSTALNLDATKEIGVQTPLGFFDPLNVVGDDPSAVDDAEFARLRYIELKNVRIAQLAFLGNILPHSGIHFDGHINEDSDAFDSFPKGWAAIRVRPNPWAQGGGR